MFKVVFHFIAAKKSIRVKHKLAVWCFSFSKKPLPQSVASAGAGGTTGTGTINEEHIRISLLSAVEEKLRRRLDEQYAQSRAELDILQQSGTELTQGKQKLDKIIERLESEKVGFI